jgi:hypothetical protein
MQSRLPTGAFEVAVAAVKSACARPEEFVTPAGTADAAAGANRREKYRISTSARELFLDRRSFAATPARRLCKNGFVFMRFSVAQN